MTKTDAISIVNDWVQHGLSTEQEAIEIIATWEAGNELEEQSEMIAEYKDVSLFFNKEQAYA